MVAFETKIESGTGDAKIHEITAEFTVLGISECPPEILDYLMVLENSYFNNDSRMVREGSDNTIADLEKNEIFKFTEGQKKELSLAALLHDIGKSSSSEDPDCQLAVVRLFSAKNISKNDSELKVLDVVNKNFPNEVDIMISNLSKVGVTPDMKIRAFWDKHAFWTKEIFDKFPVFSEETKIIAASHHFDKGINPCGIVENKISKELKYRIFILMAVDKYQARRVRGGATNEEAIEYLRNDFEEYNNDSVVKMIIETIDKLGNSNAGNLFPSSVIEEINIKERKGL